MFDLDDIYYKRLGLLVLAFCICGLTLWSAKARLADAITVSGEVTQTLRELRVDISTPSIVKKIYVTEDQYVEKGATLVAFEDEDLKAEQNRVATQLLDTQVQIARLVAERDNQPSIAVPQGVRSLNGSASRIAAEVDVFKAREKGRRAELAQLSTQTTQVKSQIAGLKAQLTASENYLNTLEETAAEIEGLLNKGLAERARLRRVQQDIAIRRGEVGHLVAKIEEAQTKLTELTVIKDRLSQNRNQEILQELSALFLKREELLVQKADLEHKLQDTLLRAEYSGTIQTINKISPGSWLPSGTVILTLVPSNQPKEVMLFVPVHQIQHIKLGQSVRVQIPQNFGEVPIDFEATISSISADRLDTNQNEYAMYRIGLDALPNEETKSLIQHLKTGSAITGYIQMASQPPLEYLTAPLQRFFDQALRPNASSAMVK